MRACLSLLTEELDQNLGHDGRVSHAALRGLENLVRVVDCSGRRRRLVGAQGSHRPAAGACCCCCCACWRRFLLIARERNRDLYGFVPSVGDYDMGWWDVATAGVHGSPGAEAGSHLHCWYGGAAAVAGDLEMSRENNRDTSCFVPGYREWSTATVGWWKCGNCCRKWTTGGRG